MNIIFSNPALLPFLLLVSVPLLIHLFARARPPVYRFSSNLFLERIHRETARLRRPRSLLLLLLRTLLILALVAIFLQPIRFAIHNPAGRFEARHVVVIIDATASMAYADGAQSRFATACAEADAALAGLTARDSANIIWLRQPPTTVLPEPTGDTGYLREALRKARVSAGSGDPEAAVTLALAQIAGADGRREICIISDFQATDWDQFEPDLPADIRLLRIPVARDEAENTAVTRVAVEPARPIVGEECMVLCELANYSPNPLRRSVFLEAGDIRQSADLLVPAWGTAVASIPCQFTTAGAIAVVASTEEDTFPVDNRRAAVATVDAHARVVIRGDESETADAWAQAITALGWAKAIHQETPGDQTIQPDLLMIAGWKGDNPEAIQSAMDSGTPVIILPTPGLSANQLRQLDGIAPLDTPSSLVRDEQLSPPAHVRIADPDNRLFDLFRIEGIDTAVRGGFNRRLILPPDSLPDAEALLAFDDGSPALIRSQHHALSLWMMPLGTADAEWTRHAEFVVFMGELLRRYRAQRQYDAPTEAFPGDVLPFETDKPLPPEGLLLKDGEDASIAVQERFEQGVTRFVSSAIDHPGLYQWQSGKQILAMHAVNVPVTESDLRTLDLQQQKQTKDTVITGGADIRDLHRGYPLWPLLLAICLALSVLEGLVAWRMEWK